MNRKLKEILAPYYPGKHNFKCHEVGLPVYRYDAIVLATEQTGPKDLDQIFFRLIQAGKSTRQQIAKCLGLEDDSFIFQHLDILVRSGYVVEHNERLNLSELGIRFADGKFLEEKFQHEKCTFYWDEICGCETNKPAESHANKETQIKHRIGLAPDALENAFAQSFNHKKRDTELAYHSLDNSRGKGQPDKKFAKYFAVYFQNQPNDEWQIEIRQINENDDFELCESFSEAVNAEPWRRQFERIFNGNNLDNA